MSELPFTPFSAQLCDVIRKEYIKVVAYWLLGKDKNSILAQSTNSAWEAALSILFLAEASDIFMEKNEEEKLVETIKDKSFVVVRWLLQQKITSEDGSHVYWEKVTWDTSVIIKAILKALEKYENKFTDDEKREILETIERGSSWLFHRFLQWETEVKYPFGPADVSQIASTLIILQKQYPAIYDRLCSNYIKVNKNQDIIVKIIEYLIHKKTEKSLTITTANGTEEEVIAYWWDDYFSTAEVVESFALFYMHCQSSQKLMRENKQLLRAIREALIRSCTYFEQGQVEGMWGSHIDTIKVIYAYVMIRKIIPQKDSGIDDPLIVPEIHTIFKAFRWMCDEKQIFSDGSFLHTMFLTVFYSLALVEVYRYWQSRDNKIEKIYDDVLWVSPVRTTPERSKRLSTELENINIREDMKDEIEKYRNLCIKFKQYKRNKVKQIITLFIILFSLPLFFSLCNIFGISVFNICFKINRFGDFLQFITIFIPIIAGLFALIWKYESIFNKK